MLTFKDLRVALTQRLPEYKKKDGSAVYLKSDGSDVSPAQWLQKLTAEIGQYAYLRSKYEKGEITFDEYRKAVCKEMSDLVCAVDNLARRCLDRTDGYVDPVGVELDKAIINGFNEVSRRVEARTRIHPGGETYMDVSESDIT